MSDMLQADWTMDIYWSGNEPFSSRKLMKFRLDLRVGKLVGFNEEAIELTVTLITELPIGKIYISFNMIIS